MKLSQAILTVFTAMIIIVLIMFFVINDIGNIEKKWPDDWLLRNNGDYRETSIKTHEFSYADGMHTRTRNSKVVHGNSFVYTGYDEDGDSDVYVFDADTGETTQVTDSPADESRSIITEDYVFYVYRETIEHHNNVIYMYDRRTGERKEIIRSKSYYAAPVNFTDGKLIFQEDLNRYLTYDPILEETKTIIDGMEVYNIAVAGENIVWSAGNSGNNDVFLYNLETDEKTVVCHEYYNQSNACISGDYIVWEDHRNEETRHVKEIPKMTVSNDWNGEIYGYKISTGEEFVIASDENVGFSDPNIVGNKVSFFASVPEDHKFPQKGVVMLAELSGTSAVVKPISTTFSRKTFPSFFGNWVVWADSQSEEMDRPSIYGYSIIDEVEFPILTSEDFVIPSRRSEDTILLWTTSDEEDSEPINRGIVLSR